MADEQRSNGGPRFMAFHDLHEAMLVIRQMYPFPEEKDFPPVTNGLKEPEIYNVIHSSHPEGRIYYEWAGILEVKEIHWGKLPNVCLAAVATFYKGLMGFLMKAQSRRGTYMQDYVKKHYAGGLDWDVNAPKSVLDKAFQRRKEWDDKLETVILLSRHAEITEDAVELVSSFRALDFNLNPTIDFSKVPEKSLRDISQYWTFMGFIQREELIPSELS